MSNNEFYEFTYDWTVENFSQCFQRNGEFVQSPIFCPDCLSGSKWRYLLYPKGCIECEQYISLRLLRCDDQMNEKEIFLEQKFELIGVDGKICHSNLIGNGAYEKNKALGRPQFMELKIFHDKIKEWNEDRVTFRCYIRRSKPQICKAITTINIDHYFFQWIMAKPNSTDWIESKQISFQESLKFQIDITASEDDVLIKVNKLECSSAIFMSCQISLICLKGNKVKTETSEHIFDSSDSDIWNFPLFIKKSQLEEEKDKIFKDDTFTLEWKFSYSKDTESYIDYTVSTLKDDLGKMLNTEKHCDVQLRSEDGTLSAHKSILSARSPVFSAMFDQNMIENKSGIVEIDDCDSNTLKIFLNYVYNDVLELNDSTTALNLLLTAEKYQVQTLKELCCSFLISNLAVEKVCEILAIADMIGHKQLKSSALNYVKSNSKKVFSSPEGFKWVENNPKLATEILCFF